MSSCAFFGHGEYDFGGYEEKIEQSIKFLIENRGVTQFYNGCRGNFDSVCLQILINLKSLYPQIKIIQVLSYRPVKSLPASGVDETVYLLETGAPPQYAIDRTNRRLVEIADYIIFGVCYDFGRAWKYYQYAKRLKKTFINILS